MHLWRVAPIRRLRLPLYQFRVDKAMMTRKRRLKVSTEHDFEDVRIRHSTPSWRRLVEVVHENRADVTLGQVYFSFQKLRGKRAQRLRRWIRN